MKKAEIKSGNLSVTLGEHTTRVNAHVYDRTEIDFFVFETEHYGPDMSCTTLDFRDREDDTIVSVYLRPQDIERLYNVVREFRDKQKENA